MIIKPGLRSPRYDSRNFIYRERTPPDDTRDQAQITIEHDVLIIDQGKIVPCCVSIAVTTCLEVLDKSLKQPLSFMYNYYQARDMKDRLSRLEILQGLKAAAKYGICTKELHDVSLDREKAKLRPNDDADRDAATRKITKIPTKLTPTRLTWAYEKFHDGNRRVELWRNAIQIGIPIIMGFFLTNTYEEIRNNGCTHIRPENEQGSDGHAVTVMGYDDDYNNQEHDGSLKKPGAFLIRDSVGDIFPNNNGCWWLPYELAESDLITESWAVISVTHSNET